MTIYYIWILKIGGSLSLKAKAFKSWEDCSKTLDK